MSSSPRLGYASVAAAGILFAIGGTVARSLLDDGMSPIELNEWRTWIAFAALACYVLLRGRPITVRSGWALLVVFGLLLAAVNVFYYLALSGLPVAVAVVIQYTGPGLVVLFEALAWHKQPSRRVTSALVLALAGVFMVSGLYGGFARGQITGRGLAAAGAAAIAFAAYLLVGERVQRSFGSTNAVFGGFGVAAVFWIVFQIPRGVPDTIIDRALMPRVLFVALFSTLLPHFLTVWGLGRIRASRAGVVSTVEPVAAALIAYMWLGQSLTGLQLLGAAAVVCGIAIVQTERARRPPRRVEQLDVATEGAAHDR